MNSFRLLGREPTLWVAALNALIMIVGTVGLHAVSIEQAGLFVVVVNALFAVVNAFAVRPISPVTFTYAVGSLVALMASYGLSLPTETVAMINMAVVPALALLTRGQVSPISTPITLPSVDPTPEAVAAGDHFPDAG